VRVVVDAMGGDRAPGAIVRGAVLARQEGGTPSPDEVILVGDRRAIEAELALLAAVPPGLTIEHAGQTIGMDESPVKALREKPDSSIAVAARLLREGRGDGFVSAGSTGAVVASTMMLAGLLSGIKRPGIAIPFPHHQGRTTLIDAGANLKCKPYHLYQYAVMGTVYTQQVLGVAAPRVGLLTVGEEDAKGNDLIKGAHRLLKVSGLNFIGNVEGRDIHAGTCDVVVCDGFTGNVVLKLVEGFGRSLLTTMQEEFTALGAEQAEQGRLAIGRVAKLNDASAYGGAPLLGVNGICIICHGRSDERAIVNAIKLATSFDAGRVNERIVRDLEERGIHRWSGLAAGLGKGKDND
jgi:glycerol-3-phosphate acyltransferase PlsX